MKISIILVNVAKQRIKEQKKFLIFKKYITFFKSCMRYLLQYFELLEFFEAGFIFIFKIFNIYFTLGLQV